METLWLQCVDRLKKELSDQQFNTWIRPLQSLASDNVVRVLAPNRFVLDWVVTSYRHRVEEIFYSIAPREHVISFEVGGLDQNDILHKPDHAIRKPSWGHAKPTEPTHQNNLNSQYVFENFIEGKSNRLSRAAAIQVSDGFGSIYNPLLIYGGVGLGKTHLIHACGNQILRNKPTTKVAYFSSERFVSDMVSALQHNRFEQFKAHYRSIDVLLVDDIQFFAGKERSQEEFFHLFNAMLEGQKQIIMTCDRYPKDIKGLEERLKSRFGWGLTTAIEPPDLETRVAILMSKSTLFGTPLPQEIAFYIGSRIHSHVRDLEGALRKVIALSKFTRQPIDQNLTNEALKDLLSAQDRQITVENIQKTVAEYYKIRLLEMNSKSRKRSVARPRQMAMALAKELTNLSLPELGNNFGGRDHTTVIHACSRIQKLRLSDHHLDEDYRNMLRILTT